MLPPPVAQYVTTGVFGFFDVGRWTPNLWSRRSAGAHGFPAGLIPQHQLTHTTPYKLPIAYGFASPDASYLRRAND